MTRQQALAGKEKLDQLMRDVDEQICALHTMRNTLIYVRQQYNFATEYIRTAAGRKAAETKRRKRRA